MTDTIHRTDPLATAMNAGNEHAVRDLLRVWRRTCAPVAAGGHRPVDALFP